VNLRVGSMCVRKWPRGSDTTCTVIKALV
jgi:hypothetical protein